MANSSKKSRSQQKRKVKVRIRKIVPNSMSFRTVVYPSQDDPESLIAHCLELDIIGQDHTLEGAVSELLEAIEVQADACEEHGAHFMFFSPPVIWQRYEQAKKTGRKIPDELMKRIYRNANKRLGWREIKVDHRIDNILATKAVPKECLLAST